MIASGMALDGFATTFSISVRMFSSLKQFVPIGESLASSWPRQHLWLLGFNAAWSKMPLRFGNAHPFGPRSFLPPLLVPHSFGGQFQSSVEEATCRQEHLNQVMHLTSAGPKAA